MVNPIQLLPVILGQQFLPQQLERTPETSSAMEGHSSEDFNKAALNSKLVIAYAGALELIHCSRRTTGGRAIDLCCGPGHFTLLLAKYFDFDEVIGVDVSADMVSQANQNARDWGLSNVRFVQRDALYTQEPNHEFSLVTCNDAAHHLTGDSPSCLSKVETLLTEMSRIGRADGTLLLMDLVRFKTEGLTNRYTAAIGREYLDQGWDQFYDDFCQSMLAAWTPNEIRGVLPKSRRWKQIVQRLLPTIQMAISVPNDGEPLRLRGGIPWDEENCPVPNKYKSEWKMFRSLHW